MNVAERLAEVRRRIAMSAEGVGRAVHEIKLIAVSKEQPLDRAFAAFDLGVEDFGENTAQGLLEKAEAFERTGRRARWHFIGRLQRNKVNQVLRHAGMVHSVDRPELAEALSRRAPAGKLPVLVQVNIGREPQKGGVGPDTAVGFACEVARLPGLQLAGLMGIPPLDTDPAPYFALLADLSWRLRETAGGAGATELSMGMTQDFEVAIRHGATMVRVGTAIFGER